MVIISRKYEETKLKLIKGINNKTIEILREKDIDDSLKNKIGDFCYFCQKQIKGGKNLLIKNDLINGHESKEYYVIGNLCYAKAKGIYIIKNQ